MVFHAGKYDIQHLGERGLGRGLVDEVLAGQVDVVTCPHCLEDGPLVDLDMLGCYCGEQGLIKDTIQSAFILNIASINHHCQTAGRCNKH